MAVHRFDLEVLALVLSQAGIPSQAYRLNPVTLHEDDGIINLVKGRRRWLQSRKDERWRIIEFERARISREHIYRFEHDACWAAWNELAGDKHLELTRDIFPTFIINHRNFVSSSKELLKKGILIRDLFTLERALRFAGVPDTFFELGSLHLNRADGCFTRFALSKIPPRWWNYPAKARWRVERFQNGKVIEEIIYTTEAEACWAIWSELVETKEAIGETINPDLSGSVSTLGL